MLEDEVVDWATACQARKPAKAKEDRKCMIGRGERQFQRI